MTFLSRKVIVTFQKNASDFVSDNHCRDTGQSTRSFPLKSDRYSAINLLTELELVNLDPEWSDVLLLVGQTFGCQ